MVLTPVQLTVPQSHRTHQIVNVDLNAWGRFLCPTQSGTKEPSPFPGQIEAIGNPLLSSRASAYWLGMTARKRRRGTRKRPLRRCAPAFGPPCRICHSRPGDSSGRQWRGSGNCAPPFSAAGSGEVAIPPEGEPRGGMRIWATVQNCRRSCLSLWERWRERSERRRGPVGAGVQPMAGPSQSSPLCGADSSPKGGAKRRGRRPRRPGQRDRQPSCLSLWERWRERSERRRGSERCAPAPPEGEPRPSQAQRAVTEPAPEIQAARRRGDAPCAGKEE